MEAHGRYGAQELTKEELEEKLRLEAIKRAMVERKARGAAEMRGEQWDQALFDEGYQGEDYDDEGYMYNDVTVGGGDDTTMGGGQGMVVNSSSASRRRSGQENQQMRYEMNGGGVAEGGGPPSSGTAV